MEESKGHAWAERLRRQRERHLERSRFFRVLFGITAVLVLIAGVALIPLPGPGLLIVAVGLFMLALEFAWAERLLERTLHRVERARQRARSGLTRD